MASAFVDGLMAYTGTGTFATGPLEWVPGGVHHSGPDVGVKRLRVGLPGSMTSHEESGRRDAQPNGRVHVTYAVSMSGKEFTSDHLGLGELLFIYSTDKDLTWSLQTSRMATYSEVNRRLQAAIGSYIQRARTAGYNVTCQQLYNFARNQARLWKFIGTQPTEHVAISQGRDFVHMAVAVSHFCNVKNVFLADNIVEAGDRLYLTMDEYDVAEAATSVLVAGYGADYLQRLQTMCIRPYVSKHRFRPNRRFDIYVGIASLMYGTQFDERDPYRLQMEARQAISGITNRDQQRRILDVMPTLDIFLRR